jgi:nucleoside-diphosphate-sugar epimerase
MADHRPTTLLTGATGLVGGGLVPLLLEDPGRRIVALVRPGAATCAPASLSRITVVPGDLTQPHLGLEPSCRERLAREVSEIVHCAADTRFGLPLEAARAVNATGTQALLSLARRCGKLEQFTYVSTVYVAGRATGVFDEAPLRHREGFYNTYQQSKYEAEQLVVDAMPDIPAMLVRLSSLIGDSRSGRVRQFNYIHQLMKLLPQNVLSIAPGQASAPIDLVPTDWAIRAFAHLIRDGFRAGSVYQICAGAEGSLAVGEMIDLTVRAYESHPEGRRWLPIQVPRLVTVEEFEAYVERHRNGHDRLLSELLRVLSFFLPHLGLYQAFENHRSLAVLKAVGLGPPPPIRGYYEKVVHHGLQTGWGKRPTR